MPKIKVELFDEELALLERFARDCGEDVTAADLVAIIVGHSQELRDLKKAERAEQAFVSGLIGRGLLG